MCVVTGGPYLAIQNKFNKKIRSVTKLVNATQIWDIYILNGWKSIILASLENKNSFVFARFLGHTDYRKLDTIKSSEIYISSDGKLRQDFSEFFELENKNRFVFVLCMHLPTDSLYWSTTRPDSLAIYYRKIGSIKFHEIILFWVTEKVTLLNY